MTPSRLDEIEKRYYPKHNPDPMAIQLRRVVPDEIAYLLRIAREAEVLAQCAKVCFMRSVKNNTCTGCGNVNRLDAAIQDGEKSECQTNP